MSTLYTAERCPYAARARIVLAEKGLDYDAVEIDLDDKPAWLYEKNPLGRVPVYEEDGRSRPAGVARDHGVPRGALPGAAALPADPPSARSGASGSSASTTGSAAPTTQRGAGTGATSSTRGSRSSIGARGPAVPERPRLRPGRHRLRAVDPARARALRRRLGPRSPTGSSALLHGLRSRPSASSSRPCEPPAARRRSLGSGAPGRARSRARRRARPQRARPRHLPHSIPLVLGSPPPLADREIVREFARRGAAAAGPPRRHRLRAPGALRPGRLRRAASSQQAALVAGHPQVTVLAGVSPAGRASSSWARSSWRRRSEPRAAPGGRSDLGGAARPARRLRSHDPRRPQRRRVLRPRRLSLRPAPGAHPGARNLEVERLFAGPGRPHEPWAVRELVGLPEGAEIVAYCHSGSRSALAALALRAAGYDARNYPGSWHEWSRHPELPYEQSGHRRARVEPAGGSDRYLCFFFGGGRPDLAAGHGSETRRCTAPASRTAMARCT